MSTLGNTGAGEGRGKAVSRLLTRMKTVWRRADGSNRLSLTRRSPAAASTATPAAAGPSTTKPMEIAPEPAFESTEPEPALEGPQPTRIMRSQIYAERANRLGERFKLPRLEGLEFSSRPDREALRVEKPIRMRIHRTCHKCQTTFGGNKICVTCEHPRCSQCPRYPVKKAKTAAD